MTATATTGVDYETGNVMETHDRHGDDVESEEGEDIPGMRNYLIPLEITEE